MKLLFCCEFYHPSVGGVQKVIREIAERMVKRGHDVTVATSYLPDRTSTELNGVHIAEFRVAGNTVRGMQGEVDRYRQFVKDFPCDAIMVKAAQQWTFDALLPVLDQIKARKVLVPCGFSGLYNPDYEQYFKDLRKSLHQWDHLIFYSNDYRDINFAREIGIKQLSVLPNGASEVEFSEKPDTNFRASRNIPKDSFVFLTVGTLTGAKGHQELAEAFLKLDVHHKHATLVLVGDAPLPVSKVVDTVPVVSNDDNTAEPIMVRQNKVTRILKKAARFFGILRQEGFVGIKARVGHYHMNFAYRWKCFMERTSPDDAARELFYSQFRFKQLIKSIERNSRKKILLVSLPREEVIQAFFAANLFVFASRIECSPLVLFEAAAAGLPVLSVPVGNAQEILEWTGGGSICPAEVDDHGYTKVDTSLLARKMCEAMYAPEVLLKQGAEARDRWVKHYTWEKIAGQYEDVLRGASFIDGDKTLGDSRLSQHSLL